MVQHILALLLVAGAVLVVVRQAIGTLRGKSGKFGSCCAQGCVKQSQPKPSVVFIPVESLKRRR